MTNVSVRLHAASNAKTRGILGNLLRESDFIELLKMDHIEEFFDYLSRQTHYRDCLKQVEVDEVMFFQKMRQYFIETYEKLYHFYIDDYRKFYQAMLLRYEVENIKHFLRSISQKEKVSMQQLQISRVNQSQKLDYTKLEMAQTIPEFIDLLKDKKYHHALQSFLDEEPTKMIFHMEMILDRYYFNTLQESVRHLNRQDQSEIMALLGMNIDMLNIQWILRGRKYFDIAPEELFNFTLNNGKLYDYKWLKQFCYMPIESFIENILKSEYGDILLDKEYMLERAMERHLYEAVLKMKRTAGQSALLPVLMLFLFEYELRDLFTIYEGIRAKSTSIETLLIRNLKGVQ